MNTEQNNVMMKHRNILNLLNQANNSKYETRKRNIVSDLSNGNYDVGNL